MADCWNLFIYFAVVSLLLWIAGTWGAWKGRVKATCAFTVMGMVVYALFIVLLWLETGVPPLRTMGETRLWYSFFLPLVGLGIYLKWKYRWILSFSTMMAMVFIIINLLRPEIHSKTLMPALQSPWFIPHVIVYMFSYALFGVALLMVLMPSKDRMQTCDSLVYAGLGFYTIGMLLGALWAQDAWGHYWAWDPKETWAAITWFAYLSYIHIRRLHNVPDKYALAILVVAFVCLQVTWWGVNYLPSAQGLSIHTYTMD